MHNFDKFPELTNAEMDIYYFQSPHKQIMKDFRAKVTKVNDGDTIKVKWSERDFETTIRFLNIAAPEMSENGGEESQSWLENKLMGQNVDLKIDPENRVDKWGRILARVELQGLDVGEESILAGKAVDWDFKDEGNIPRLKDLIPSISKELEEVW